MGLFDGFIGSIGSIGGSIMDGLGSIGNSFFGSGSGVDPAKNVMASDLTNMGDYRTPNVANNNGFLKQALGDGKNLGWLTGGASIFKDLGSLYTGLEGIDLAKQQMNTATNFANEKSRQQVEDYNTTLMHDYMGSTALQQQYGNISPEEFVAKFGKHANVIK